MHLLRDEDRHPEDFRWQFNGAFARATATQAAETNVCTSKHRVGKTRAWINKDARTSAKEVHTEEREQTDAWIRATGWTSATWQFPWPRRYSLTVTPCASVFATCLTLAFPREVHVQFLGFNYTLATVEIFREAACTSARQGLTAVLCATRRNYVGINFE